ncbi:hypothetical protein SLA2020_476060 [Shorea laevis]
MTPTGRPRGRPRKMGHTRMHAAWDAMRPLGFTQYMVVKTVKELLQVYGEEGWKFIEDEENSYKVLVDAILEKVEKREKKKNDTERASSSNKSAVEIEKTPGIAFPSACCADEDEPLIGELQVTETPDSAAQTPKQPGGSDMKQRRRHYYHGWISNDWEEDLVELKPGPLAEKVAKLLLENVHEKRKRWDVKPEDM